MRHAIFLGPPEFTPLVAETLGGGFDLVHAEAGAADAEAAFARANVVVDASMQVRFDAARLERMPALELLITATTGADHIDAQVLERRGIPLLTLAGQRDFLRDITPAAEHSWLLLMACARRLRAAIHHVEAGGWDRQAFPGLMLRGRSLGVVGCGRIGTWMSRYARAFGMRVHGYDPYLDVDADDFEAADLDAIFAENDFVSIHVPYNDETHEMITAAQLRRMRSPSVLINTSRGAIVSEADLLAGLEAGRPSFLGVDVLTGEPDVEKSAIWGYARDHDNVIITPHIGGFSPDALGEVLRFTASRVVEHFGRVERSP
ncbi:MAG TPA: NAD(P)-dependent oxidoreductase [Myxococcota bacterium]